MATTPTRYRGTLKFKEKTEPASMGEALVKYLRGNYIPLEISYKNGKSKPQRTWRGRSAEDGRRLLASYFKDFDEMTDKDLQDALFKVRNNGNHSQIQDWFCGTAKRHMFIVNRTEKNIPKLINNELEKRGIDPYKRINRKN